RLRTHLYSSSSTFSFPSSLHHRPLHSFPTRRSSDLSAVDTTSNPASDLQQAFGTPTIAAGDTRHATWTFRLFAPFEATMSFNYTLPDGHTTGSASVHFTCGPSVQRAAAPAVTTTTTPATSGEL